MKRNKKTIVFAAVIFFSIIFPVIFKWVQTGHPFTSETIRYGTIIFFNALITGSIAFAIYRKFSKKTTLQLEKHVIPAFIGFVLFALIISLSVVSIGVYIIYQIEGYDTTNFIDHLIKVEIVSATKQFSVWILIGSAFFFYIIWRKAIEREQLLREENLKYKYRNLKSQVNPHFLFNSLNTLSELVYVDAKTADNYIQKLSGIYRYILENEDTDLIPLKKEIEFIQQYFDLQKARDNDKILLQIDVQNEEEFQIIPVSLQLLVENALKHNAMSREQPLIVKITKTDDYMIVSNTIQRKNTIEDTTRTGLSNLRERVKLIMDRELIVHEDAQQFIVKLPITRIQNDSINH
jgi:two-component system, LytTR family, sensor kinase